MAISEDAAAIAASNLVAAHVALAAPDAGTRADYEKIKGRLEALFTVYFDSVRSGAIRHSGSPAG